MLSLSLKRKLLAGGAALALVGSTLGLVFAQQGPSPTPSPAAPGQTTPARPGHQAFLDALAQRLGITSERLQQALTQARDEVGPHQRGTKPGFGRGGHHAFGRGPRLPGFGKDLSVSAQAIGISIEQLRQELPGQSLAQVAQAHGKNPSDVASALENAHNQRVDQAVAAGRLTAERASQLKQQVAQRVDQHVNQVVSEGGRGFRGPAPGAPSAAGTRI